MKIWKRTKKYEDLITQGLSVHINKKQYAKSCVCKGKGCPKNRFLCKVRLLKTQQEGDE